MRILVPYSATTLSEVALNSALSAAHPGDAIIVAAPVVGSRDTPLARWRMRRAARALVSARRAMDARLQRGVTTRYIRARARTRTGTTLDAAAREQADVIVLAARRGFLGAAVAWFAAVRLMQHGAPCPVRLVSTDDRRYDAGA